MVVKILEARGSCKGALDYSEKKVSEFVASVAAVRNLPDNLPSTIYDTLLSYESNPRVAAQTRDFRFHMAVNPGRRDSITRDGAMALINKLMNDLGYSEQPYVVYQHNDIEREHYHVVSVRVNKEGSVIDSHFEGVELMRIAQRYEEKYGFVMGKGAEAQDEQESLNSRLVFDPCAGDTYAQMRRVFESACRVRVMREKDLFAVLEAKGLSARVRQNRRGEDVIVLQGVSPEGVTTTKPVTMESTLGFKGYQRMREWVDEGLRVGIDEQTRVMTGVLVTDALDNTQTASHFCRYMQELGFEVSIERASEYPQPIRTVRLYDRENAIAFCVDDLPPEVSNRLFLMETTGAWRRASRMEAMQLRGQSLVSETRRSELWKKALDTFISGTVAKEGRMSSITPTGDAKKKDKGMSI